MPAARSRRRAAAGTVVAALLASALLAACGDGRAEHRAAQRSEVREIEAPRGTVTRFSLRRVDFWIDPDTILEVRALDGRLLATHEGRIPTFEDPTSFVLAVDSGETALSPASLAALFNGYVFDYDGAPLSDLEVEIDGDELVEKGTLHKGVAVPFTMRARPSVTSEGAIRLHPTELHAAGLPVGGLLDFFGVDLAAVLDTHEARGVTVVDDDLLLDPTALLPPPRIRGRVTGVRLAGDRLVETFGDGDGTALEPPRPRTNYLFFRGGSLGFGKLVMHDADLEIADADPSDPFAFFLSRFHRQLVAGSSRTLADMGLLAEFPDADDVDIAP